MLLSDAGVAVEGVLKSEYPQPDSVLLKEPGLYCFLLRCGKPEAEPFMEWAVPAGSIEVLTDANNAPHFKRADLDDFWG